MKKILQRTLIVFGVFIIVIAVAVSTLTRDKKQPVQSVVTDAAGTTYVVIEDKEKKTTYAVVTDEDGNRYAAQFDGNTVGSTVENINDKIELTDVPTNFTGEHTVVTNDPNAYQGEVVTQAPGEVTSQGGAMPATTVPVADPNNPSQGANGDIPPTNPSQSGSDVASTTAPAITDPELKAYRIEKYQQYLTGGTYLMEMTTNDPELTMPITMAIKNGNMYVDTTMDLEDSQLNVKMLYKNDTKTMYMIIDEVKKYCELPEDLLGEDMDMAAMMSDFEIEDIGEVSVSKVNINGQELILESYVASDGSTVNYYFNGDNLVRRDNINPSGTVDSIYFSKFTTDVPDSTFEIPDGYGYLNLSWIGFLM